MTDTKKTKRSNSTKLMGMLETTLGKLDRSNSRDESSTSREDEQKSEDTETPDILPILRGSSTRRKDQPSTNGIMI